MKIVFNSLLIVAACAATFFSFSHSSKFKSEQAARLSASAENTKVTANAEAVEANLADTRETIRETQEEQQLLVQSISALKSTESGLKREMSEIESTLQTQAEEFAALEKTIEEVRNALRGVDEGVTIDNIGERIAQIEGDITDKAEELEKLNANIEATKAAVATNRNESQQLTDRSVQRSARIARNATESVVTAVNQDWGFVVIGAGSNSGFRPQAPLLVQRDGRLIGRVRPAAVEATQTIADIDFNTITPGVRIQPGDRVIFATPAGN